ncbi:siderophore-interacting protein [Polaromonas sp. A23]|uniref:siderophore-interacting protein n=1 Tax=Polaromonas sp. A23 TaxID=1944133 RepID=UPI000986AD65|nr:siderophore-interacting protein [Polaromonas sp. A23]OOG45006.1 NADPH-dependent ferric siderophore reductase [Polaromonas sp. A23]
MTNIPAAPSSSATASRNDSGTGEAPKRQRRPPRRVEVRRVEVLSPAMRRITLAGAELEGFMPAGPASYIKLIFPEPGQTEPTRPLPDGPRAVSMRTYTPLAIRPEALEVDVDFVLHGEGPASTWAAQATVGQVLFLMGPGPGYTLDPAVAQHLLIADDSALPAVETILAALPATARAQVLLEVISHAEQRPLHSAAQLDVSWLPRGTDHRAAGEPLIKALRALSPIAAKARVYLACEAAAMRRIRQLLIDELGVSRGQIVGRGYWKLDVVNHPDHDYGDDA